MKIIKIILVLFSIFSTYTGIISQVKNCDISFLDSNHVGKSYFKTKLLSLNKDALVFSESGNRHTVPITEIKRLGYIGDSRSTKGMLIGAGIGAGLWITFAILVGSSSGGHPDFSVNFGEAVGGTLVLGLIGGIIGGAIGGFSNKKEYVSIDLSKMTLNEKYDVIDHIFKTYDISKE